jgi:hypothetical protein
MNLPSGRTRFIGRVHELSRIQALLEAGAPLVTITGAAGMGKTRLALRHAVATLERNDRPGGVWFCDLSEARSMGDMAAHSHGAKPNSTSVPSA